MHTNVVNVVNIIASNDSKSSSLEGDIVAPNNDFDHEDNLEGILSFRMLSGYNIFLSRVT